MYSLMFKKENPCLLSLHSVLDATIEQFSLQFSRSRQKDRQRREDLPRERLRDALASTEATRSRNDVSRRLQCRGQTVHDCIVSKRSPDIVDKPEGYKRGERLLSVPNCMNLSLD